MRIKNRRATALNLNSLNLAFGCVLFIKLSLTLKPLNSYTSTRWSVIEMAWKYQSLIVLQCYCLTFFKVPSILSFCYWFIFSDTTLKVLTCGIPFQSTSHWIVWICETRIIFSWLYASYQSNCIFLHERYGQRLQRNYPGKNSFHDEVF